MKPIQAVILAAGAGSRMKSATPKVLHPICGRPMIAYALDLAASAGVKQPVVILGEAAEAVQARLPKNAKVVIQKSPLGTGDAILTAKRALGASGDLLVLYADTPLLRRTTIQRLMEAHRKSSATGTLLTSHLADPSGYGRVLRNPASGAIVGVVEESDANVQQRGIREVNVGPCCAKAQALFEALAQVQPSPSKKEWYLTQAFGILSQREGVKFHSIRAEEAHEAIGINTRHDLVKATAIIRQRIFEGHLANGVTIVDPSNTYIDQGVAIGADTTIHPGTMIESDVAIGKRCDIGPYARLRSGVVVENDSRIGNFVELVRTTVGSGVRINHVAYLGDATVDDDVNIGAGTITANFSGTEKLPTVIGKGAFIGCNTVLIAPVKVGPGAVTGAGSVVTKGHDVPPRSVVVGVPARPLQRAPAGAALRATPSRDGAAKPVTAKVAARRPAPRHAEHARDSVPEIAARFQGAVRPARPAPKRVSVKRPKAAKKAVKKAALKRTVRRPTARRLVKAARR